MKILVDKLQKVTTAVHSPHKLFDLKDKSFLPNDVAKCRASLGLEQDKFARLFDVNQATIARWESNKNPTSMTNSATTRLNKILIICDNPRLKILFVNILFSEDGYDTCNALLNLLDVDITENSKKINLKLNALTMFNIFIESLIVEEIPMSDRKWILETRGKIFRFDFQFDDNSEKIKFNSERGIQHVFRTDLVCKVLSYLHDDFEKNMFPLANNVQKLSNETEQPGLGSYIYQTNKKEYNICDTSLAQGASYLGPFLEHLGVLEWNGVKKGIKWRFCREVPTKKELNLLIDLAQKKYQK